MFELCDMHGHFLPGMDDGCKTAEESLQLLTTAQSNGIEKMFATPHYYPVETVEAFLARRSAAADQLSQAAAAANIPLPAYCLGAEVAYHPGLGQEKDLSLLCLGDSRYMLLEMPFRPWTGEMLRTVRSICINGFVPVIAHVERYWRIQSDKVIGQLLEMEVLVQMNAGSLLHWRTAGLCRRLLQHGVVQLLGSDCHNLTSRPANLHLAIRALEKRKMLPVLEDLSQLSLEIFQEARNPSM